MTTTTAATTSAVDYRDYLEELPLQTALWWFIENVSDDTAYRSEMFFALRQRVRLSKPLTVVLEIDGGVICEVSANGPCRVIVLDADTEGGDPENIHVIDGETRYVHDYNFRAEDDSHPEYVERLASEVDLISDEADDVPDSASCDPEFLANLKVGQEVLWTDPDQGVSSGIWHVVRIDSETGALETPDTLIALCNEAGGEAEVYGHELSAVVLFPDPQDR